jgi:hypothetical protein
MAPRRFLGMALAAAACLAACSPRPTAPPPPAAAAPVTWVYASDVDSMSDASVQTGCRKSAAPAQTAAGQSQVELCFQQKGKATHAWMEMKDNGVLRCDVWPGTCPLMVRLDNGEPFQLTVTEQPGVPNRLYIADMRDLLSRIAGAERLLIQAPVDTKPPQDVAFYLDGLDFNRLQVPADAFKAVADSQSPTEAEVGSPISVSQTSSVGAPRPPRRAPRPEPHHAPGTINPDSLGKDPVENDRGGAAG